MRAKAGLSARVVIGRRPDVWLMAIAYSNFVEDRRQPVLLPGSRSSFPTCRSLICLSQMGENSFFHDVQFIEVVPPIRGRPHQKACASFSCSLLTFEDSFPSERSTVSGTVSVHVEFGTIVLSCGGVLRFAVGSERRAVSQCKGGDKSEVTVVHGWWRKGY